MSGKREFCFVLYLLGNKIRETKMFDNMLPVSAVFHSCGRLCHRSTLLKIKLPHKTHCIGWCMQRRNLQLVLIASCCETTMLFLVVDLAERLPRPLSPCSNCLMHRQENKVRLKALHKVDASFMSRVVLPSTA